MKYVTVYAECPLCDPHDEAIPEHNWHGTFRVSGDFIDHRNGGGEQGEIAYEGSGLRCEYADTAKVGHYRLTTDQQKQVDRALWDAFDADHYVED